MQHYYDIQFFFITLILQHARQILQQYKTAKKNKKCKI